MTYEKSIGVLVSWMNVSLSADIVCAIFPFLFRNMVRILAAESVPNKNVGQKQQENDSFFICSTFYFYLLFSLGTYTFVDGEVVIIPFHIVPFNIEVKFVFFSTFFFLSSLDNSVMENDSDPIE